MECGDLAPLFFRATCRTAASSSRCLIKWRQVAAHKRDAALFHPNYNKKSFSLKNGPTLWASIPHSSIYPHRTIFRDATCNSSIKKSILLKKILCLLKACSSQYGEISISIETNLGVL